MSTREVSHLGRPCALDAVHLATALSMRDDLAVLIAYDRELLAAARAQGLTVASPGMT